MTKKIFDALDHISFLFGIWSADYKKKKGATKGPRHIFIKNCVAGSLNLSSLFHRNHIAVGNNWIMISYCEVLNYPMETHGNFCEISARDAEITRLMQLRPGSRYKTLRLYRTKHSCATTSIENTFQGYLYRSLESLFFIVCVHIRACRSEAWYELQPSSISLKTALHSLHVTKVLHHNNENLKYRFSDNFNNKWWLS